MTEVPANMANDHGHPLPGILAEKMSRLFGADFSDVRIAESSLPAACGTIAVAYGEEIRFAPGVIDGWSVTAERILAHELTHVLQYRSGRAEEWPGQFEVLATAAESGPCAVSADDHRSVTPRTLGIVGFRLGTFAELELDVINVDRDVRFVLSQQRGPDGSFIDGGGKTRLRREAAAGATYRVSGGGGVIIRDCALHDEQPKMFFATAECFRSANAELRRRNMVFRLVYIDPFPVLRNAEGVEYSRVAGSMLSPVVTTGWNMEAAGSCRKFVDECKLPDHSTLNHWDLLAPHYGLPKLSEPRTTLGEYFSDFARAHATSPLRGNEGFLRAHRLEHYADPSVGEEFYSGSLIAYPPGDYTKSRMVFDYSRADVIGQILKQTQGRRSTTWGDHVGLVTAKDGDDVVVVQTYARDHEGMSLENNRLPFFQMYSVPSGIIRRDDTQYKQSWHVQWTGNLLPVPGLPLLERPVGYDETTQVQTFGVRPHDRVLVNHTTMVMSRGVRS